MTETVVKKRGRPLMSEEEKAIGRIQFRVPPAQKAMMEKCAAEKGYSSIKKWMIAMACT